MNGKLIVTMKFANQLTNTAILDALPRAFELNISAVINQGTAPVKLY
jgi:hypothetical protein